MSFLTINNIPVPVLNDGPSQDNEEIGYKDRTADGTLAIQRTAFKQSWNVRVQHMNRRLAPKYRDLILGKGELWPFNYSAASYGFYGSRGTPVATAGGGLLTGTTFQHGVVRIPVSGAAIEFDASAYGNGLFTFCAFRNSMDVMFINQFIACGTGRNFLNGVYNSDNLGDLSTYFEWTGNRFKLKEYVGSGNGSYFTEVVVLPYVIPDEWAPYIYGVTGVGGFGLFPQVKMNGDLTDSTTVNVVGEVAGFDIIKAKPVVGVGSGKEPVIVTRARLLEV